MENVWLQLIITVGTVLGASFTLIKYLSTNNRKKDKEFLDFLERRDNAQLEYYENKNGHLERISNEFTKAINKNTRAIDKLATKIK